MCCRFQAFDFTGHFKIVLNDLTNPIPLKVKGSTKASQELEKNQGKERVRESNTLPFATSMGHSFLLVLKSKLSRLFCLAFFPLVTKSSG